MKFREMHLIKILNYFTRKLDIISERPSFENNQVYNSLYVQMIKLQEYEIRLLFENNRDFSFERQVFINILNIYIYSILF